MGKVTLCHDMLKVHNFFCHCNWGSVLEDWLESQKALWNFQWHLELLKSTGILEVILSYEMSMSL